MRMKTVQNCLLPHAFAHLLINVTSVPDMRKEATPLMPTTHPKPEHGFTIRELIEVLLKLPLLLLLLSVHFACTRLPHTSTVWWPLERTGCVVDFTQFLGLTVKDSVGMPPPNINPL